MEAIFGRDNILKGGVLVTQVSINAGYDKCRLVRGMLTESGVQ